MYRNPDNPEMLEPFLEQFKQPSVEQRVEQAIEKGLNSSVKGWVMSEILKLFSGDEKKEARNYILNRCNITETP